MQQVDRKRPPVLWMIGSVGLVTAIWLGNRVGFIGFVIGFPTGAAVMLGILSGASMLGELIHGLVVVGVPAFPVCRNRCCRGGRFSDPGDYTIVWNDDGTVRGFRCRCGNIYQKVGRRFVELGPSGTFNPYLIWNRLKGWCPEGQTDTA
jgi:hypothetical protein